MSLKIKKKYEEKLEKNKNSIKSRHYLNPYSFKPKFHFH